MFDFFIKIVHAQVSFPEIGGQDQDLSDLIVAIYNFAFAIVGFAVFIQFLIAGFLWVTAAGRANNISRAKDKMRGAIIGAILLVSSWLILNVINPDLVGNTFDFNLRGVSESVDYVSKENPLKDFFDIFIPGNGGTTCPSSCGGFTEVGACEITDDQCGLNCVWDHTNSWCLPGSGGSIPADCVDVDGNNEINNQDCGSPENDNCSLCGSISQNTAALQADLVYSDPAPIHESGTLAISGGISSQTVQGESKGFWAWFLGKFASAQIGTHNFTIRITDAKGATATKAYSITVVESSAGRILNIRIADLDLFGREVHAQTTDLIITPAETKLKDAVKGDTYYQEIHIRGGSPPYTWKIISGSLPIGLQLTNGAIASFGEIDGVDGPPGDTNDDGGNDIVTTYTYYQTVTKSDNICDVNCREVANPDNKLPLSDDRCRLRDDGSILCDCRLLDGWFGTVDCRQVNERSVLEECQKWCVDGDTGEKKPTTETWSNCNFLIDHFGALPGSDLPDIDCTEVSSERIDSSLDPCRSLTDTFNNCRARIQLLPKLTNGSYDITGLQSGSGDDVQAGQLFVINGQTPTGEPSTGIGCSYEEQSFAVECGAPWSGGICFEFHCEIGCYDLNNVCPNK